MREVLSCLEYLFVGGVAVGGVHGRNRLMGNSLLDIIVFGRHAGQQSGKKCKETTVGKLSLAHVEKYAQELKKQALRVTFHLPSCCRFTRAAFKWRPV